MKKFLQSFLGWGTVIVILLVMIFAIFNPLDHYMVDGDLLYMSQWSCTAGEYSASDGGMWVACERHDETKSFRILTDSFSAKDRDWHEIPEGK